MRKITKKVFALMLIAALILSLAACSGQTDTSKANSDSTEQTQTPAADGAEQTENASTETTEEEQVTLRIYTNYSAVRLRSRRNEKGHAERHVGDRAVCTG